MTITAKVDLDFPHAPPLRPRLVGDFPDDLMLWANFIAGAHGLRSLYRREGMATKYGRCSFLVDTARTYAKRLMPEYREAIIGESPYMVDRVLVAAGDRIPELEAGWWVGLLQDAYLLAHAYGIVLGEDDVSARTTARIWRITVEAAYSAMPDEIIDEIIRQVTAGRAGTPSNIWDLAQERMRGVAARS